MFCLVTAVLMFLHMWRLGLSGRNTPVGSGRRGTGAGVGLLAASAGGAVQAVLLGLGALVTAGVLVAMIVIWLLPVPPAELNARREVTEALRAHAPGRDAHASPGRQSKHLGSH